MTLAYRKLFDPPDRERVRRPADGVSELADRAPSSTYVYAEEITLAINVALATGRPLLVRGPSGAGKSSLARAVADDLGWGYVETVITSRTRARDLLWQVDLLKRLQDAQAGRLSAAWTPYVMPGPLWWAFDPASARRQLAAAGGGTAAPSTDGGASRAVLLIDEIDKADPDVPNNLLRPLGSLGFEVEELGVAVAAQGAPLVVITTNEERDLPPAFLRRCVELVMPAFDRGRLVRVGRAHHPDLDPTLLEAVADLLAPAADRPGRQHDAPNAAEYLDTVRACAELDVRPGSETFSKLAEVALWKRRGAPR